MNKKEKRSLALGIFVMTICLFASIFFAIYLLIPKDTLNIEIKNYYINSAIEYFDDNSVNTTTIDNLIKMGYAKKQKEFEDYSCDYKTSYINKENKILTLRLNCKNHTDEYKIVITED